MTFKSSIILSDFGFKIHSIKNPGILFLFFLLVGISSCKKDTYVDSEAENIQPTYISGGKISKEDAIKYYSNFSKRNNSGSFNNTLEIINLSRVELFWDASQITLYKSDLELLLVPARLSAGLSMQMGREILFVFYADSNNIVRHRIFIISATEAYLNSEPLNFGQTFTGVIIQLDSLGAVLPSFFIRDGILESIIRPKTELTSRFLDNCVVVETYFIELPSTYDAMNGNGCDVSCLNSLEILDCVGMGGGSGDEGGGTVIDPFGTGNNDPFDFGTPGSTGEGGGSGTGENPGSISNYFNINHFEGDERRVASLINEFKKQFGLTQSSLDILNTLLNECQYFPDFKKISGKLSKPCSLDDCVKTIIIESLQQQYGITAEIQILLDVLPNNCFCEPASFLACLKLHFANSIISKLNLIEPQSNSIFNLPIEQLISVSIFLDEFGDDGKDYIHFGILLREEDETYRFDRMVELYRIIDEDPNALISDCVTNSNNPGLQFWSDLANFIPGQPVIDKINSLTGNYSIQDIESASGKRINLDYFGVKIQQMPKKPNGQIYSTDEFISHFRKNINDFHTQIGTSFNPIAQDISLWNSNNPLAAVISISIFPDDGSVICSDYQSCCWVFTTLKAPNTWFEDGAHPVSGNRQFGISSTAEGFEFYIKGADRVTKWYHNLLEGKAFKGADALWSSIEDEVADFINTHDGQGSKFPSSQVRSFRPNWNGIKSKLKVNSPINSVSCY